MNGEGVIDARVAGVMDLARGRGRPRCGRYGFGEGERTPGGRYGFGEGERTPGGRYGFGWGNRHLPLGDVRSVRIANELFEPSP